MTENDAIKWLKEMQNPMISEAELYCAETCYGLGKMVYPEPEDYVFEMAIQALEEIQQYRAIGTVDELQVLNRIAEETAEYVKEDKKILEAYKRIGTIEEFKALKEKNEPKKVIRLDDNDDEYYDYQCPSCGAKEKFCLRHRYCSCGQLLEY